MLFCPYCHNLLLIEKSNSTRYFCKNCNYQYNINKEIVNYTYFEKKQLDSIYGVKEAWENVATTEATCKKCENDRAYFKEIQIRSADEPATLFFKCANIACGFEWREG